jgi:hypothetical protein
MIKQKCSNCGHVNMYTSWEYRGRDKTECHQCKHILTICNYINLPSDERGDIDEALK